MSRTQRAIKEERARREKAGALRCTTCGAIGYIFVPKGQISKNPDGSEFRHGSWVPCVKCDETGLRLKPAKLDAALGESR